LREGAAEQRGMDMVMDQEDQDPPSAPSQLVCRICIRENLEEAMAMESEEELVQGRPLSWAAEAEGVHRMSATTRCSSPGWRICRRRERR